MYLLECLDGSLYTGITNNLLSRMIDHQNGTASKYTRAKKFKCLVAWVPCSSRSEASALEYKIKSLPKNKKISMFID